MKIRQLSNQLLVTIILVCSFSQIWAGPAVKGAGGKSKNATSTSKEMTQTTKQPKVQHKIKTTTTTTTTKPELETTTLPGDLDLDSRSAFINNQYVPDTQVPDTAPPLYDLLQQQMVQTVLSNTAGNMQVYSNDSPQMKEALEHDRTGVQNPPGKPAFAFDLDQFDDYDDEGEGEGEGEEGNEYGAEGDYMPDNCEDTQESLGDNDGGGYGITAQNLPALQNNYGQGNLDNKPYDSSNYPPQGGSNQGVIVYGNQQQPQNKQINDNNYSTQIQTNQGQSGPSGQSLGNNNKPQNNYGTIQSTQQYNQHNNNHKQTANKPATKPKPSSSHNSQNNYQNAQTTNAGNHYVSVKPLEQYGQNIQKPQQYQRPQYNGVTSPQNTYNNQKPTTGGSHKPHTKPSIQQSNKPNYQKPTQGHNQKPYYGNNNPTNYPLNSYNNTESLTSSYGSFNTLTPTRNVNPSLVPNFSYGNTNTENIGSPFSTTSDYGKYPTISGQKRHLTFRTVSSATQYVSTPLADLMFKFSIGMAKPTNGKLSNNSLNNQAHVFNVLNDSDAKSEGN
ncbi:uncharacterized protein ACRADG_002959 [Cochliomyia hominivorax]